MLVAVVLPIATGVLRSEAVVLASMLAFPLYLGLMILAFADGRPFRLYLVFTVVAAMSWGGALGLGQIVEVH